MKREVFEKAHEIVKKNNGISWGEALKKAWEIVKLIALIEDKCCKLSKDFKRLNGEKRMNLISIQSYINMLYEIMNKNNVLNTKQEKCLLDIKLDISTMIYTDNFYTDNYSNYNELLRHIVLKMALYNI